MWLSLWILLLPGPWFAEGAPTSADSFVTSLTIDTFDKLVPTRSGGAFVNFYMPWCKYSKKLALDYELLAHTFLRVKDVTIARVNCEEERSLCDRMEIKGYPTLLWFPRGSREGRQYKEGRSSQEMIRFINEQTGIQVKPKQRPYTIGELSAESFVDAVKDEAVDSVVQFHIPGDEASRRFRSDFELLASALSPEEHVRFWALDAAAHPQAAAQEGVRTFPHLRLYRRGGRGAVSYNGKYTSGSILPWLNEHTDSVRLMTGVTNTSFGRVPTLDALVDRLTRSPPNAWASLAQSLQDAAAKLPGKQSEYGRMYAEAVGFLISDGGAEALGEERLAINQRLTEERDPAARARLHARRNVLVAALAKAQRNGMQWPPPPPPGPRQGRAPPAAKDEL